MIANTLTTQSTSSSIKEPLVQPMNRREFLLYTWGAALTLLSLEGVGVSYLFLAPRFRAGEFGGKFGGGKFGVATGFGLGVAIGFGAGLAIALSFSPSCN